MTCRNMFDMGGRGIKFKHMYLNQHGATVAKTLDTKPCTAGKSMINARYVRTNMRQKACPVKETHWQGNSATCPNCGGSHPASYKGCPKYKQAQEIVRVQTLERISYAEAVRRCKQKNQDLIQKEPSLNEEKKETERGENTTQQSPSEKPENSSDINTNKNKPHEMENKQTEKTKIEGQ